MHRFPYVSVLINMSNNPKFRMFKVDTSEIDNHDGECSLCRWEKETQYVLAQSQKDAVNLVKNGEAGFCGDCMCDMLVEGSTYEGPYVVMHEEKKANP